MYTVHVNTLAACWPIPVAARSKAWVCGSPLAAIAVSNTAGAWMSLMSDVCCQVEVSAPGRSLAQRSPIEWGVSECDLEASIMRRSRPTEAAAPW